MSGNLVIVNHKRVSPHICHKYIVQLRILYSQAKMLSTRWSTRLVAARTCQDVRSYPLRLQTAKYASLKVRYKNDAAAESARRNTDSSRGDADTDKTADSSTDGSKQDRSIFSHSSGGPLGGIVDKTKELQQRFQATPGATFNER